MDKAFSVDPLSIIMVVAILLLIFLMFRNTKKRKEQQQQMRENMRPGVEVMLTSGIYGRLVELNEAANRATIQCGSAQIEVHAQAIAQIVPEEDASSAASAAEPAATSDVAPDDDPEFGERVKDVTIDDTSAQNDPEGHEKQRPWDEHPRP